ncbi:MAG: sensor histidine kinase [Chloroflexota bacterium]
MSGMPAARILVVEDEEEMVISLQGLLAAEGYEVEHASGVSEALAKIDQSRFDAAVLDLRLDEADGLTVLARLREASPRAGAVVLAGEASIEHAVQAFRAGVDDILLKPSHVAEVKGSVARALRWRSQMDDLTLLNAHLRSVGQQRDALLLEAQRRATAIGDANRLKDELLATTSHDLKGPLTSIKGYTQLLLRRLQKGAPDMALLAQALETIDAQTNAMVYLVDDLLDAARIQAGVFEPRPEHCDLTTCLSSVLARLAPSERQRIDVSRNASDLTGTWERSQIERVLANVLGNALKYSPAIERVSVVIDRRDGEIEVAVSDRGMGIPGDEIPKLFERFQRTPQARASGLSGTGLGLFLCRGIVRGHGGQLWVESPGEGEGATFRFTLPRRPARRDNSACEDRS